MRRTLAREIPESGGGVKGGSDQRHGLHLDDHCHRQFLPEPGIAAKRGGDPTGPVNFISNGGFEVATPAMNKFGSSSVLTQVTGPVHGGTTALQVTSSVSTAATPGFTTYRESRASPPVGH